MYVLYGGKKILTERNIFFTATFIVVVAPTNLLHITY